MEKYLQEKYVVWALRVAVFGEFFGHGIFALQKKAQWIGWISKLTGVDTPMATTMLMLVGAFDILIALSILVKPMKPALLWAIVWGFFTALLRPLVKEPIWDFVERWANWGAPLALLYFISKKNK
ncbi:MAG: hypothetical protein AAB443_02250 [Patescibacteria group bacterium]